MFEIKPPYCPYGKEARKLINQSQKQSDSLPSIYAFTRYKSSDFIPVKGNIKINKEQINE